MRMKYLLTIKEVMKLSDNHNVQLNEKKLKRMKFEILKAEEENLKTRERSNETMVELIRRIITDEVKKTY